MKKRKFFYKIGYSLAYRLLTVVFVFIIPIFIVAVILTSVVISKAGKQVEDSYQLQINNAMERLEEDIQSIDIDMDSFIYKYVSELNVSGYPSAEMTGFEMLTELSTAMKRSGQKGYVSVFDKQLDKILVHQEENMNSAAESDELLRMLKKDIRSGVIIGNYYEIWELGHYFLLRNYDYLNYQVVFWFDMGENLSYALHPFFDAEENVKLMVYGGTRVYQVDKAGTAEKKEASWDSYLLSDRDAMAVTWKAAALPLEVSLRSNSLLNQIKYPRYLVVVGFILVCIFMILALWKYIRLEVLIPIAVLKDAMEEIQSEHLDYRVNDHKKRNSEEVQYLYDKFDKMAEQVQHSSETDKQMYQTQLDNLRLQVNPHMLLNSFNTIYSLAQSKNYECIQEYSLHLVDYFRYSLRRNEDMVLLYQELDFVQNFIEIQKIRFPKSFSSVYNVEESCKKALIPPLLIENFVENSMKYALKPGEVVEVLINIRKEENRLIISVSDTGRGIKKEILEQIQSGKPYVDKMGNKHIGIWNCKRRVELYYGEVAQLNIISTFGEGTQVFINIPFVEAKDEANDCR